MPTGTCRRERSGKTECRENNGIGRTRSCEPSYSGCAETSSLTLHESVSDDAFRTEKHN